MTQSLFVAEPQTGKPGVFADLKTTLEDVDRILSGAYDEVDPDLFLYITQIDEAWSQTTHTTQPARPNLTPPVTPDLPLTKNNQSANELAENSPKTDTNQSAGVMVLSDSEAQVLQEEKAAAKKQLFSADTSIKDKYTATLLSEADLAQRVQVKEHLENASSNYTPTQMTEAPTTNDET